MNRLNLWATIALCWAAVSASAQTAPPDTIAPEQAASAAAKPKPEPRLLAPTESRDKTAPPGELRPERQVTPQLAIPVGRNAPAAPPLGEARSLRPAQQAKPAMSGNVDDAVARCSAEVDEQARAKCRDSVGRDADRPPR